MARELTLEPKKKMVGNNTRWVLFIPPYLSPTGKKQRRFFETKAEAQSAAELVQTRKENFGTSLSSLTANEIVQATKALEIVGEFPGRSLIDAATVAVELWREQSASVPFAQLFDEFLASKASRSADHKKALGHTREKFAYLHDKLACEITGKDLNKKLATLPPGTKNAEMRYLKSVFNLAIKRGWRKAGTNPIAQLDFEEVAAGEVEIFNNQEVSALLGTTLDFDIEMVPFFVFGFFCGIRPDGELQKLQWDDVHLSERQIVIQPKVSKTKRRRFVDISENALAWVTEYQARGGSVEGRVCPFGSETVRNRRNNIKKLAKLPKWIQQGMRHTYCSAWLALHEDVNKLVLQSGHTDPDTMWEHYHRGMKKADADLFWSIRPKETEVKNIVSFAS